MHIVIAPDSFKESLSAHEVATSIAAGIRDAHPSAKLVLIPMADGGEGTLDVLADHPGAQRRTVRTVDALGRPCEASWLWLSDSRTAFIEMASTAGLDLIAPTDRDIVKANTLGVGEIICEALDAGARHLVLTAGGSATNDGGLGMLHALGLRLRDAHDQTLEPLITSLADTHRLDLSAFDKRVKQVRWTLANDVNNPLCGPHGASAVFGPQKGATPEQVQMLDTALSQFAQLSHQHLGFDKSTTPGAGAAGGFGFAAIAWLNADVAPGAQLIAQWTGLEQHIRMADLVVTGEGKLDSQTAHGKAPVEVMRLARKHGVPVVAFAGMLGKGYEALYDKGLLAAFSLVPGPVDLAYALEQASPLLQARSRDMMRLILGMRLPVTENHSNEQSQQR